MELKDVRHNQTVTLATDAEFRGYVFGRCMNDDPVLGPVIMLFVKEPGKTGRHGVTIIPLVWLVKVQTVLR